MKFDFSELRCPWCKGNEKQELVPVGEPTLSEMVDGEKKWHQVFEHKGCIGSGTFTRWTYDIHDLLVEENNVIKSKDYPNLIAPLRHGIFEYRFFEGGLEVWYADTPFDPIHWFEIKTPGLYAVYGTCTEDLVVMPLDK